MNKRWIMIVFMVSIVQGVTCGGHSLYSRTSNFLTKFFLIPSSIIDLFHRYSFATKSTLNNVENTLNENMQASHNVTKIELQNLVSECKKTQLEGLKCLKDLVNGLSQDFFLNIATPYYDNMEKLENEASRTKKELTGLKKILFEVEQNAIAHQETIKNISNNTDALTQEMKKHASLQKNLEEKIAGAEQASKVMERKILGLEVQATYINKLVKDHLGLSINTSKEAPILTNNSDIKAQQHRLTRKKGVVSKISMPEAKSALWTKQQL